MLATTLSFRSQYDEASLCVAKKLLTEKDRKRYEYVAKVHTGENASNIARLLLENYEMHKKLRHLQSKSRIVALAMEVDPHKAKMYQGLGFNEANDELQEKIHRQCRVMDELEYQRYRKQKRLEELQVQINDAKGPGDNTEELQKDITRLENLADKVKIKEDTGKMLASRYERVLSSIKSESHHLLAKIETFRKLLDEKHALLQQVMVMEENAKDARDEAKKDSAAKELDARQVKEHQMQVLFNKQQRMEELRLQSQVEKQRMLRTATRVGKQTQAQGEEIIKEKEQNHKTLLNYVEDLQKLQKATHTTKTCGQEEVAETVKGQRQIQGKLYDFIEDLEKKAEYLRSETEHQKKVYHNLKYDLNSEVLVQRERGGSDKLMEDLEKEETLLTNMEKDLQRSGETLITFKLGFVSLDEKLKDIILKPPDKTSKSSSNLSSLLNSTIGGKSVGRKLPEGKSRSGVPHFPSFHEPPPAINHQLEADHVCDIMEVCFLKINKLLKELGLVSKEELSKAMESEDFINYLEVKRQRNNVRVKISTSAFDLHKMSFFTEDHTPTATLRASRSRARCLTDMLDDNKVLTRKDIHEMSDRIVRARESRTKKEPIKIASL